MDINKNSLKLVLLPGRNPPIALSDFYNKTYACWKDTWENAALDVEDMPLKRNSTEFLRQDEVLALFHGPACSSLGLWTELDFRFSSSKEDYYFRNWTPEALNGLTRDGNWVGMYSYLTVAKGFRRSQVPDLSFKDLQIGLFVMRFLHSSMDSMTGCTRNNRGVDSVCTRGGAQLLEQGRVQFGCATDLMAWYKDSAHPWPPVAPLVERLWAERIDFRNFVPDGPEKEPGLETSFPTRSDGVNAPIN